MTGAEVAPQVSESCTEPESGTVCDYCRNGEHDLLRCAVNDCFKTFHPVVILSGIFFVNHNFAFLCL
jgi:hypothetical protein